VMWVMWKLILVRLGIVLTLTQDMCTVCTERTRGSKFVLDAPNGTPRCRGSCGITFKSVWRQAHKSFWTHPMVLLGDDAQVEARYGTIGDDAKLGAR
jgi:hypothetical protein